MIWFTSLPEIYDSPKINFAYGAFLTMSIGMKFDIEVLRCISSDPCEHAFRILRQNISEFTVSKMMDLIDGVM